MAYSKVIRRGENPIYEMIEVASDSTKDDAVIVLLPGNPGVAEYYYEIALTISQLTMMNVIVLGWLGFASETNNFWGEPAAAVTLENQIQHAKRVVAETFQAKRIALVGHSIGALVAFDILCSQPMRIGAVAAIMPFVADNFDSDIYTKKRSLATFPGATLLAILLSLFLRLFPIPLRRAIMHKCGQPTDHMSSRARDLTVDTMTRLANLRSMLHMGISEFKSPRIQNGPDTRWHRYAQKVGFIYASGEDAWVRSNHPTDMKSIGVPTIFIDSNHDVCTRIDTSQLCATAVVDILRSRGFLSSVRV
eukprot:CAMPEP_0197317920 /NCGR_PEP_ID=MMETSP0891-20130614/49075_1 /TAXON_ID=44058 ORGANISM="Aureoumbra lagunensis, Strain CCMP1510" /NCGR_SAMPLE_ID=MMETSP0891 /ASSEMBLY_ACC=CAM_ASM_000534 /LENGTH=305 /DNA_ID=CAMNT_0042808127 /DNA_START=66 /DNA_END=983 /DNA_ORIENTATION=-